MKKLYFILLFITTIVKGQQADILIKNGKIVDGTGNSWLYGDIAVTDGKIMAIGHLENWKATKTIDATGLIVAPGFIDVHTHIENQEKKDPEAKSFIYDGVTTVITGNCGDSHTNIKKYFSFLDSLKTSINVGSFIGHNDVRKAVMGTSNRTPTEAEMQQMEGIVEQAMKDGAVGFSTGLIYIPGTYSKTPEVVRLAKAAAKYHGVYASHIRNEADSVVAAINEALNIGREAHMPVEVSHFKLVGEQNWGRSKETLPLIIKAREEGIDATIDQYPYTASSTTITTMLPSWALADGQDSIKARLQNENSRKRIIAFGIKTLKKRSLEHFSYAVVANYKADTSYNGKSIEEVNQMIGHPHTAEEEMKTVMDIVINGGSSMVFHGMCEEDVQNIMKYPFNMFASDGGIRVIGESVPHPRSYGTNARVLGKYVRELKIIPLEEAIRRMTSLPAQKFQLKNMGLLREGYNADIVLFDEKTVSDIATYDKPHQYSVGFKYVIINGKLTVEDGKHNGTRSGRTIRKG
ncbi:N-acyl-D-amino-acid deacylase family protein [Parasediminibacterium sp. JCM 36343]|uniref:N-acyl-D-amino-acid deacylase family protein n=1 Tax=Parasediminibacterium sp. JCM 36343 TaxID=3374279 RepID=UPI0039781D8C